MNVTEEAAPISEPARRRRWALVGLVVILAIGLALVLAPLATPIILASWVAHLSRPVFDRLSKRLHGATGAAAALTLLFILMMALPLGVIVATIIPMVTSLREQLGSTGDLFGALVSGNTTDGGTPHIDVVSLAKQYGASVSKVASVVLSTSTTIVIGVFVFLVVVWSVLTNGERARTWLESHAPVDAAVVQRLSAAFYQTGRGLLIGSGGTALAQGITSGVIYFALGIPRAILLAFLTSVASLIPVAGSAVVWVPVAAGLILTGQLTKGIILIALGAIIVGSIDNVLRPWLSKRGAVGLPTVAVFVAMFGGITLFGPWGIFLGPLVAKLAIEALEIARERHLFA